MRITGTRGGTYSLDADLAFVHGLEQRGLGARGGPVDLVRQQHVGEDRTPPEAQTPVPGIQDLGAENVGRQEIGCELHTGEVHR